MRLVDDIITTIYRIMHGYRLNLLVIDSAVNSIILLFVTYDTRDGGTSGYAWLTTLVAFLAVILRLN